MVRITEKEEEKLSDLFDYLYEDWSHHKQYALVEIAKIIYWKKRFNIYYPDVDPWIPS